jgi:hypothetical protein
MTRALPFYWLIIPTILASVYLFVVFAFLGVCSINQCLGSGNATFGTTALGILFLLAGSLPLISSSAVLLARLRKKPLGSLASTLIWTLIVIVGAFGILQGATDPGDAKWMGAPLMMYAALFAFSMLYFPNQQTE